MKSEERFRLLVESSGDLVAEIDSGMNFLYISPNVDSFSGYKCSELMGTSVFELLHPEDAECIRKNRKFAKVQGVFRYRHADGSWHWLECIGQRFSTFSGQSREVVIARDITTRRQEEEELKNSRVELLRVSEHLQTIVDEERKRISRELHDELGQLLTVLKFDIYWLKTKLKVADSGFEKRLEMMQSCVMKSLESVKRIAQELRPPQLEDVGIVGAIQRDVAHLRNRVDFALHLEIDPPNLATDMQLGITLYRVFNEALTNIVRHATAKHVDISLTGSSKDIVLEIKDDGRGIRKEELEGSASLGLVGMRERVRQCNGQLEIRGEQGKGTTIKAQFPVAVQVKEKGS